MKRVGFLMERIIHPENLRESFLRAAKGKYGKREVILFREHLDEELNIISNRLQTGDYNFGNYRFFTIHDPKERVICAATFPNRVVFHAMMRICHPIFDNYQIYDSYASRKGKGVYKALERACYFAARYSWFAKLDMCHYFDSIDHGILLQQLSSLFKDKQLLFCFQQLLDSYHVVPGKGLPIGNLTSQYFANHYLSLADHYAKEQLRVSALIRYMDDILFFSNSKDNLLESLDVYISYIRTKLLLNVHPTILNTTASGIPFCGYVVYPHKLRLSQRSRKRYSKTLRLLASECLKGRLCSKDFTSRLMSMTAFVRKADSRGFRKATICSKEMILMEQALTE